MIKDAVHSRQGPCNLIGLTLEITFFVCARLGGLTFVRLPPDQAVQVLILGKTLNSHSASLYPGVQMGTDEFHAGDNPGMH